MFFYSSKSEVIQAINCCNLQRNIVALQVQKRCCTRYYHPPQTLSRNKISLLQVEAACCTKLNWRLLFQQIFSTSCNNKILLRAWECLTMYYRGLVNFYIMEYVSQFLPRRPLTIIIDVNATTINLTEPKVHAWAIFAA